MKRALSALLLVGMVFSAQVSYAQSFFGPSIEKAGRFSRGLRPVFQDSYSESGQNGSSSKFDSETGFRFAFDGNFNSNLLRGIAVELIRPDRTATIVDVHGNGEQAINCRSGRVSSQMRGIFLNGVYHYLTLDNADPGKPQLRSGRLEFGHGSR